VSQFLNSEQIDAIGKALDGEEVSPQEPESTPEPVESAAASEEEAQVEAPETNQETSESADMDAKEASSEESGEAQSTEEAPEEEDNKGSGKHRVPYSRFQEVVHARNKYQSEVDDLRTQQGALQKELERLQSVSNRKAKTRRTEEHDEYDDNDLDDDFIQNGLEDEDSQQDASAPWETHYKSLEERVQRFELEQAKSHLEEVLAEAHEKYPSVPRQAILQHIVDKPPRPAQVREKVFELAERYTSYIAQVEEAAIAKHLGSLQEGGGDKISAPRPSKTSSGKTATLSSGEQKPKTLKEAKSSLLKFMRDTNPFV
jgi:hypothetical protein